MGAHGQQDRPIIIGIAGDSATGKTTLASGIAAAFGEERVAGLDLDSYHRYSRAERRARGITALHPDSNNLDLMEQHLLDLAAGETVLSPVYNHAIGDFAEPRRIRSAPVVIVEGLLALATPQLRRCYDLTLYLDPPEDLRRRWKIGRDCSRRGYTPSEVTAEMERRRPDAVEFIHPQRRWADLVLRFCASPGEGLDDDLRLGAQLIRRSGVATPDFDDLVARQGEGPPVLGLRVRHDDGRLTEILEVDGRVGAARASAAADALGAAFPALQAASGARLGLITTEAGPQRSHTLAFVQLLIAAIAGGKLSDESGDMRSERLSEWH